MYLDMCVTAGLKDDTKHLQEEKEVREGGRIYIVIVLFSGVREGTGCT